MAALSAARAADNVVERAAAAAERAAQRRATLAARLEEAEPEIPQTPTTTVLISDGAVLDSSYL